MVTRVAVPEPAIDGGAQVAALLTALQTQEALLLGAFVVAVGAFLLGVEAAQRNAARRRRHRGADRTAEIRALRRARSQRLADTTFH
ncbi:MAG: hypothetical protein AAFP17_18060 [Pseudomonadota bacterium]